MIVDLQIRTRQYYICVYIILVIFMNNSFQIHFDTSLGSVILPLIAEAATTRGDARYVFDSISPILPGKFLLVVLIQTSSFAKTPMWAPQQAPHVGGPTTAPASIKISIKPSFTAFIYIDCASGKTSVLTFTFFPFKI